jgi:hypothetical protein
MIAGYSTELLALPWAPHDVNGEDTALVPRQKIIDKIADDRVRFVAEFGHDAANQCTTAAVPFQIDRAVHISRAVNFRPTVRASRLLRPNFDKAELLVQLRIAHDLAAQRSPSGRDDLDHRLHL